MTLEKFLSDVEKAHVYDDFENPGRLDKGDVILDIEQVLALVALVRLYQKAWMQKSTLDFVNHKRTEILQKAENA